MAVRPRVVGVRVDRIVVQGEGGEEDVVGRGQGGAQ